MRPFFPSARAGPDEGGLTHTHTKAAPKVALSEPAVRSFSLDSRIHRHVRLEPKGGTVLTTYAVMGIGRGTV